MAWFVLALLALAFIIPIIVAWIYGNTYLFALSVFCVGLILYFANVFLTRFFIIKRRSPPALENGFGQMPDRTGIIPGWVSALAIIGIGFIPSSLIIALLLWLGFISR
jgi:hypothetical protein